MTIRFTTLFMRANNNNLLKDVGMIPYTLYKKYGWESTVASYDNEDIWTVLDHEVKGLNHVLIHKLFHNMTVDGMLFIFRSGRKIDILNIYHFVLSRSFVWALCYKMINPKGQVYLKMDIDLKGIKYNDKRRPLKNILQRLGLCLFDVVSAETETSCDYFKKKYKLDRIICIPNGFYKPEGLKIKQKKRENHIFTAARLGTEQKATDILLEAFQYTASRHNFDLVLAGTIEDSFRRYIVEYYCKYPDMRKRVRFLGAIEDKLQLWSLYEKSRIFILSSRWESFGIAAVEAIANGCYPVLTDAVISKDVITNNYSFGKIAVAGNFKALSKAILEAVDDLSISREDDIHETIRSYAFNQFEWENICERLYNALTIRMVEQCD